MLVVQVDVHVLAESVAAFLDATRMNAASSLTEPGVLRFDVVQDNADAGHVVFVEVYRDADAAAAHKQTEHYAVWRDAVASMMARPRSSTAFTPVFPGDEPQWATPR